MRAEVVFRRWLAIGLAVNALLLLAFGNRATPIGPYWLWLIAIPLLAWLMIVAKLNLRQPRLSVWGRAQAIRRVNR